MEVLSPYFVIECATVGIKIDLVLIVKSHHKKDNKLKIKIVIGMPTKMGMSCPVITFIGLSRSE